MSSRLRDGSIEQLRGPNPDILLPRLVLCNAVSAVIQRREREPDEKVIATYGIESPSQNEVVIPSAEVEEW